MQNKKGEYQDDKMCGIWYYFENTGILWMVSHSFSKNTISIINEEDQKIYTSDYKCYSVFYYPNGNIQSEGLLLWSEGETLEFDFSREYGGWKYYGKSEKFIQRV